MKTGWRPASLKPPTGSRVLCRCLPQVTLAEALAGSSFNPDKKTLFTCEGE